MFARNLFRILYQAEGEGGSSQQPAATTPEAPAQAPAMPKSFGQAFRAYANSKGDDLDKDLSQAKEIYREASKEPEAEAEAKLQDPTAPDAAQTTTGTAEAKSFSSIDTEALAKELGIDPADHQTDDGEDDPILDVLLEKGDKRAIRAYINSKAQQAPAAPAPAKPEEKAQEKPTGPTEEEAIGTEAWNKFYQRVNANPGQFGDPAVLRTMSLKDYAAAAAKGDIEKLVPPPPKDADAMDLIRYENKVERLKQSIQYARDNAMREAKENVARENLRKRIEEQRTQQTSQQEEERAGAARNAGMVSALRAICQTQGIEMMDMRTNSFRPEVADFAEKVIKLAAPELKQAQTEQEAHAAFARGALRVLHSQKSAGGAKNNVDIAQQNRENGNQISASDLPTTITPGSSGAPSGLGGGQKVQNFRTGGQFKQIMRDRLKNMGPTT